MGELIDSVLQIMRVACHHGDAQTNKPAMRDGRLWDLSIPYVMLIRTQQALPFAKI